MRNLIMGASAMLAAAAMFAPGVAAAQTTGYVGALYSSTDVDGADDIDAWGVEGSVFFPTSGSWGVEVDASLTDGDDSDTAYGLAGHLFTRSDAYLFGGYIAVADSDDSTTWVGGVEANKYYDRWTLAGAVSYGNNDDLEADGFGVNVGASVFATDNFRIDAGLGWANIDVDAVGDDDVLTYGLGAEYQLDAAPISFTAGWSHAEADETDVEADTWSIGVRYNFGGQSLHERDRNGASQASRTAFGSVFSLSL